MKPPRELASLGRLLAVRERAVDRLSAQMAEKARVRDRFRVNLERMAGLCAGDPAPGVQPLALAMNFGHYKQAVLRMADTHRADLVLHEADMAVTQRALQAASRAREALDGVLALKQQRRQEAERRTQQRHADEIASQRWSRTEDPWACE